MKKLFRGIFCRSSSQFVKSLRGGLHNSDIAKYLIHVSLSVILGILVGYCSFFFHLLLEKMKFWFEPPYAGHNFLRFSNLNVILFLTPIAGSFIVSLMTYFAPVISKEKGVISVIKSISLENGFIPIKRSLFHFFAPIFSIGMGIPLGPESPASQFGGGIGSYMSQILKLKNSDMKMFTAAGAGAAVSAVFNAPIAGVFFGIEAVLSNDIKNKSLSALIIASVVADIISRSMMGNTPIFSIPFSEFGSIRQYPLVFLFALITGMMSVAFLMLNKKIASFYKESGIHNIFIKLMPISILYGAVLLYLPALYGIGYDTINQILNNSISVKIVAFLFLFKFLFVIIFFSSGSYGGVFAPALGLGAMAGFLFASGCNYAGLNVSPVLFTVLGMSGALAGINSIPLTSILLVFEITHNYHYILPLMIVSTISFLCMLVFNKKTIYALELSNYGIDLGRKNNFKIIENLKISDLEKTSYSTVSYKDSINRIILAIINSENHDVFVVNNDNSLVGVITIDAIKELLNKNDLNSLLIAKDLLIKIPYVYEDDKISNAIEKLKNVECDHIPIVLPGSGVLTGSIKYKNIINSYNKLITGKRLTDTEFI